jgi:hypothetical protein
MIFLYDKMLMKFNLGFCVFCVGKMKALLAAKRSPVRWGSQKCLIVSGKI